MTKQEAVIISTYTGILMCNFSDVHKYIEQLFNRSVYIHELADSDLKIEIKKLSRPDFLKICNQNNEIEKQINTYNFDYAESSMIPAIPGQIGEYVLYNDIKHLL